MAKQFNDPTITAGTPGASDRIPWFDGTTGKVSYITLANLQAITGWTGGGGGDVTAPTVVSMTVEDANPDEIVVVFSEAVTGVVVGDYSFKKNGSAWADSSVSGAGTTWTFTMATTADSDDVLLASYSGTGTVNGGSDALVAFTDDAVTNNVASIHKSLFTGANGTLITAYTPDIGAAWTEQIGTAEIQSNKYSSKTFSGTTQVSLNDVGATDYVLTAVYTKPVSAIRVLYIFFRQVDTSNKMFITVQGNSVNLLKIVSGGLTDITGVINPSPTVSDTNEHTIVLTVSGNLVSMTIDGTSVFTSQPIDVALAAGTVIGIGSDESGGSGNNAGDVVFNSVTVA